MVQAAFEKLEQYINKDEVSQPRTPEEYILWFEEKLEIIKAKREGLKKQILLHEGISKYFHEELFPLYRLLQYKCKDWTGAKFSPVKGNQNYDVKIESNKEGIPKYIEITTAEFNEDEHNRMEYFSNSGHVDLLGKVSSEGTQKTGKQISIEEVGFVDEELVSQLTKDRIKEAIKRKIYVTARPDHTALLLSFDDYIHFRYDDDRSKGKMNAFLDSNDVPWGDRYTTLYLVGASGKSFYERLS